jgi:excisionase family DNA binding protein
MEDRLLLESEAAAQLRVSRTTVKRLRLAGALGYIPGRPVRIPESALATYVASCTVPSAQQAQPMVTRPVAPEITTAEKAERDDVLRAKRYWLRRRLR